MLSKPVSTPDFVVSSLKNKSYSMPERSRCESFIAQAVDLKCLVCTAPASRQGVRNLVLVLVGLADGHRRAFLDRLEHMVFATGLKIPKVDLVSAPGATILLAPWVYRGEFRALAASAVASYGQSTEEQESSSSVALFSPSLPQILDAHSGTIDLPSLKLNLYGFAIAYDPVWRKGLRRVAKFEDKSRWVFPLGCTVEEAVTTAGVSWEVNFKDVEILERAHGLVDARLDSGKADNLSPCSNSSSRFQETQLPAIRIRAGSNSRESRIEMARLLQAVLVFLDRMRFVVAES